MLAEKTHREIKNPQISGRYLADYMAASETAKRTIVRNSKFQPIARVVQHDEAKMAISKFLRERNPVPGTLTDAAHQLRERMVDSDFERDVLDHNADYLDRFALVCGSLSLPTAEVLAPGRVGHLTLHGVKVTAELHARLRRLTKTNKIRSGAAMLRYAKSKALAPSVAEWQSAFLYGFLTDTEAEPGAEPEHQLCLTIDAYLGVAHPAPGDAARRYQHMKAACASIAERWPNVQPPPGARF